MALHPMVKAILDNAREDALKAAREMRRRPAGECAFCDEHGDDQMMPSHTPSERCESGKRPHCTCDVCF